MRRASFFSPSTVVSSAKRDVVVPLLQHQRAALNFRGVAMAGPQYFHNSRFNSWQWLLAGVMVPSAVWASSYYVTNHQVTTPSLSIGPNELPFSEEQVLAAATWWARFLKQKSTNFSEINKNTGIKDRNFEVVVRMGLDQCDKHSDEQIQKFIEILSKKIQAQKLKKSFDLPHVQIGDRSTYGPPQIVRESLDEANIYGMFQFKTEMRIYTNGHVMVNDEIIHANPSLTHYDNNTSFDESTRMVISGGKFREITIPLSSAQQGLWEGYKGNWTCFDPKSRDSSEEKIETFYTKICLSAFKGSEAEFLKLTNEEWVGILGSRFEFNKYLNETASIFYTKRKLSPGSQNSFGNIGPVAYQPVGQNRNDYYEYTTGPVRVLSAPKAGTIGRSYLQQVQEGDLVFKREAQPEQGAVYYLPASSSSLFSAKPLSKVDNPVAERAPVVPGFF